MSGVALFQNRTEPEPADGLRSLPPVVSCPDPGPLENGRRVLSGPHFNAGSTVQYICNKGFTLSGNSLLTCFNRGASGPRWNQKLPRCLRTYRYRSPSPGLGPSLSDKAAIGLAMIKV